MFGDELIETATGFIEKCRAQHLTVACAESCTGGLISALLTEIPGASDVFTHGFITYANQAKSQMLDIPASLIETHGAVSEPVARAMAQGALAAAAADLALAATGIAGPGGGSAAKPVGLVHIAVARRAGPTTHARYIFDRRPRAAVRLASVNAALELANQIISQTAK